MNAEELIIAHFDKSLSPEQEAELQQHLSGSADARALYERHQAIENMMVRDSAALEPSRQLDEVVIASVLGLGAATQITGGAGLWFSGKIAAAVSAVALGGIAVAIFSTSAPESSTTQQTRNDRAPAVLRLPTLPPPASAIESADSTPATETAALNTEESVTRTNTRKPAKPVTSTAPVSNPIIDLNRENPTVVQQKTTVGGAKKQP